MTIDCKECWYYGSTVCPRNYRLFHSRRHCIKYTPTTKIYEATKEGKAGT